MQKQTLGEVRNWMVIWWQVVSEIFAPKIIKICWLVFKLQSKMLGCFGTQCNCCHKFSSSKLLYREKYRKCTWRTTAGVEKVCTKFSKIGLPTSRCM